jgi:hypothetical protein
MLKGKHFSDVEDMKSSVKEILTDIPLHDFKKAVLNSCRSPGNIAKNWREITYLLAYLLTELSPS